MVGTYSGISFGAAGRWDILLLLYGDEANCGLAIAMVRELKSRRVYACVDPASARRLEYRDRPGTDRRTGYRQDPSARGRRQGRDGADAAVPRRGRMHGARAQAGTLLAQPDRNERIAAIAENIRAGKWSVLRGFGIQKDDIIAVAPEATAVGRDPGRIVASMPESCSLSSRDGPCMR